MEATLWQRLDEIITRTVRPMAERCDEESLFCGESVRALADAGFMGLPYPPEQGGRGSSYESYVRCVERLSKACPSVGVTYATHVGLACHPLHAFGSPMQKESFLRPMLRGDKLGAFALTEPEAGSDVGAIATTAELDGGFYVINGHKIFITNAGRADIYILFARTGGQGTEGLSAFVVCSDDAGLLISAPQRKMGIRGAQTCELFLRNLCIPADRLIGRLGDGFRIAMETLDGGRLGIAAQAVGIADARVRRGVRAAQGTPPVRPHFGAFPRAALEGRGHVGEGGSRPPAHPVCGPPARRGEKVPRGSFGGQARGIGSGRVVRFGSRADMRRQRLFTRICCGTLVPRCQDHPDL